MDRVRIWQHNCRGTFPKAVSWTNDQIRKGAALEIKHLNAYGKGNIIEL